MGALSRLSFGLPLTLATGAVFSGVALAAAAAIAAPSESVRFERIRATKLSNTLLGQFTPAAGDPRLIARYAQISSEQRRRFSFTPVMGRDGQKQQAITVVVRARAGAERPAANAQPTRTLVGRPLQPRNAPIETASAITPVAYKLGPAVGLNKFAIPTMGAKVDIGKLPSAAVAPEAGRDNSRFASRISLDEKLPVGRGRSAIDPETGYSLDVGGSYRVARNVDVTAGVRYRQQNDRAQPLTDARQDSQAVYVGTQFRF